MFYNPTIEKHGLAHNPINSCVVPRPIGWISTMSPDGVVNLAPYSFFNLVNGDPPMVMFSAQRRNDGEKKDSQRNAEDTGEFVFNLATAALTDQMNLTASIEEPRLDELATVGLTAAPSQLVRPPRVAESPIHFECRLQQVVTLKGTHPGHPHDVLFGDVLGIHIADEVLTNGDIDMAKLRPLARLGYNDYAVIEEIFTLKRLNRQELAARGF